MLTFLTLRAQAVELSAALIVFILYMVFLTVIGVLVHFQFALRSECAVAIAFGQILCSATLAFYVLGFDIYPNLGNVILLVIGIGLTTVGSVYHHANPNT